MNTTYSRVQIGTEVTKCLENQLQGGVTKGVLPNKDALKLRCYIPNDMCSCL